MLPVRIKTVILTVILLLFIPSALYFLLPRQKVDFKTAREIAKNWIKNQAPTYVFDGFELKFIEEKQLKGREKFQFKFSFKSRAAGYGNRTGKILPQVITPHNIRITVKNGEVTRAITDGRYDEINKQMLAPEEREKTASVQLIFYRTINGQEKPVAVEQKIKYNDSIEKATLKELLAGPQEENIYSLIDENTEILDFKIKDNKAKVNFSGEIEPAGGSAWVAAIKTQIKRTLTQFDSIEKVEIAVEGETEAILQP